MPLVIVAAIWAFVIWLPAALTVAEDLETQEKENPGCESLLNRRRTRAYRY